MERKVQINLSIRCSKKTGMMDILSSESIQNKIYTIRGTQVLYGVEVKRLNEQVKRNSTRFPEQFMFTLSHKEFKILKSQFATSSWGGRRTLPYAFSEQGVAMLSAVLRSEIAVATSIRIMNAFVDMRRFIKSNEGIFQRLARLELKQLETEDAINGVLQALERKNIQPRQGIFFDGQIFDAYEFISDL
jgi:hypothetical protein